VRGRASVGIAAVLLAALPAPLALGWIYNEHRAIGEKGIQTLEPRRRAALDRIWTEARSGYEERLCALSAVGSLEATPKCLDLADWPAIAGDHSCTPEALLETVLESDWILTVADVAWRTAERIERAKNEAERRNFQALGDLGLERADREYSTRAGSNNAHFLIPRASVEIDPVAYAHAMLGRGSELNAAAIYVVYHLAALRRAADLSPEGMSSPDRAAAARQILALESFALHFLQDSFAAGHIAGSWGPVAERKGTHDYYNEHGLDASSWDNQAMQLFGDGHMRAEDLDRASHTVRLSLESLLDALDPASETRRRIREVSVPQTIASGAFDVCKASVVPDWTPGESTTALLTPILKETPVPFRGPGFASLPRFRAEIGSFLGLASGVAGSGAGGGFTEGQSGGVQGSLDVGLRFGLGLEALLGDAGDGLIFLQAGLVNQSRSTSDCGSDCPSDPLVTQFVPAVPARSGLNFRLRLPFWVLPGDLILATPILAFTNPTLLKKMGIRAADGGVIAIQRRISTGIGGFQFMAGREVGVTLFGYVEKDAFLAVVEAPSGRTVEPIAVKSIQWEFPLVEYRPFREYGSRYTYATFLQIGAGLDRPVEAVIVGRPDVPGPTLRTRYFGFVRIFFDGRRYF
jgi:hypothetical protein